jgi:hypothetical protein
MLKRIFALVIGGGIALIIINVLDFITNGNKLINSLILFGVPFILVTIGEMKNKDEKRVQ